MSVIRVLRSVFIVFAHAATAAVHLWWNDLAKTAVSLVRICLASPGVGIVEGIAKLHMLVLFSFAVALSFRVTSATQIPTMMKSPNVTLTVGDSGPDGTELFVDAFAVR